MEDLLLSELLENFARNFREFEETMDALQSDNSALETEGSRLNEKVRDLQKMIMLKEMGQKGGTGMSVVKDSPMLIQQVRQWVCCTVRYLFLLEHSFLLNLRSKCCVRR